MIFIYGNVLILFMRLVMRTMHTCCIFSVLRKYVFLNFLLSIFPLRRHELLCIFYRVSALTVSKLALEYDERKQSGEINKKSEDKM